MNIWMKICRKQATCYHCKEPIWKSEKSADDDSISYMVVGQYWNGKWRVRRNWHPQCWIEQGKLALAQREYVEGRGRPKMNLDAETRKLRFKLLARRASVVQRLKKACTVGDTDKMIHLGEMLEQQKEEIESLGGVPSTW